MKRVRSGLGLASTVIVSNVWLLEDAMGRRFLVDTGHFAERYTLLLHLWLAGVRRQGDLTAILLTHRHSDHAGNAAWLRKRFDCPVICHEHDRAFLTGECRPCSLARGQAPWVQEFLCYFEDWIPARSPVDEVYEEGGWKWGFQVVPVPGHTEGSVMLFHEPSATLFSGDAIIAGPPPLRSIESFRLAFPGFSLEADRCHAAVREYLRELPKTEAVCSGHGPAVLKDSHRKLMMLAE